MSVTAPPERPSRRRPCRRYFAPPVSGGHSTRQRRRFSDHLQQVCSTEPSLSSHRRFRFWSIEKNGLKRMYDDKIRTRLQNKDELHWWSVFVSLENHEVFHKTARIIFRKKNLGDVEEQKRGIEIINYLITGNKPCSKYKAASKRWRKEAFDECIRMQVKIDESLRTSLTLHPPSATCFTRLVQANLSHVNDRRSYLRRVIDIPMVGLQRSAVVGL